MVLTAQDWPGNVRQLENTLRSAAARSLAFGSGVLSAQHLQPPGAATPSPDASLPLKEAVAAFERHRVSAALAASDGNRSEAAKRLGISRQWLHRLMKREEML